MSEYLRKLRSGRREITQDSVLLALLKDADLEVRWFEQNLELSFESERDQRYFKRAIAQLDIIRSMKRELAKKKKTNEKSNSND